MPYQEEQIQNTCFNWKIRWQVLATNATLIISQIILELAGPGIVILGFKDQ